MGKCVMCSGERKYVVRNSFKNNEEASCGSHLERIVNSVTEDSPSVIVFKVDNKN